MPLDNAPMHAEEKNARNRIAQWMRDTMRAKDWSAMAWGQAAGTAPSNISRFIKDPIGSPFPKPITLRKLAKAAGVRSPHDPPESSEESASFEQEVPRYQMATGSSALASIAEYDVHAAAGAGMLSEEETPKTTWGVPGEILQHEFQARPASVAIITVEGDSMEPDLKSGDRVMVDLDRKTPSPPGIFVLWDGLGRVTKFVEHVMHSEPPTLQISSSNPRYKTYERALGEAHILGRVIGLIRRV